MYNKEQNVANPHKTITGNATYIYSRANSEPYIFSKTVAVPNIGMMRSRLPKDNIFNNLDGIYKLHYRSSLFFCEIPEFLYRKARITIGSTVPHYSFHHISGPTIMQTVFRG